MKTIFRCIQETKESRNGKNHTKPKRERLVFNLPGIARRVVRWEGMRMAGVCCQRWEVLLGPQGSPVGVGILRRPLPDKGHCLGDRWHWGILLGTAVVHCCCLLDSPDNLAGRWVGIPDQGVRPVLAGSWVDSSCLAPSLGIGELGELPDKVALCGSYLPARQLCIRAGLLQYLHLAFRPADPATANSGKGAAGYLSHSDHSHSIAEVWLT